MSRFPSSLSKRLQVCLESSLAESRALSQYCLPLCLTRRLPALSAEYQAQRAAGSRIDPFSRRKDLSRRRVSSHASLQSLS